VLAASNIKVINDRPVDLDKRLRKVIKRKNPEEDHLHNRCLRNMKSYI
jgi:hypothetical protein